MNKKTKSSPRSLSQENRSRCNPGTSNSSSRSEQGQQEQAPSTTNQDAVPTSISPPRINRRISGTATRITGANTGNLHIFPEYEEETSIVQGEYVGAVQDGKVQGFGKLDYTNNAGFYHGDWHDGERNGRGVMRYRNGSVYSGEWNHNQRNGDGTMGYANGDRYQGRWNAGLRNGQGTMEFKDGSSYTGLWENDAMHGSGGKKWYGNGDMYEGHWQMGQRNGHGTMLYSNGDKFEGEWRDDKRCDGNGKMHYADNGGFYQGGWKDKKKHGRGRMTYSNGDCFEGEWKADERIDGIGTMRYENGDVYVGEWQHGKRHGKGMLTSHSGSLYYGKWQHDVRHGPDSDSLLVDDADNKYIGPFQQDKKHGRGKMEYANGDIYTGEWQDGLMHGQGKLTLSNGQGEYNGSFRCGLKHGQGRLRSANGTKYEGEFVDNQRLGKGILTFPVRSDGKVSKLWGTWENNFPNGIGYKEHSNGDKYFGMLSQGKRDGGGMMLCGTNTPNGSKRLLFSGEWESNQRLKGLYFLENDLTKESNEELKKCWSLGRRKDEANVFKYIGPRYRRCGNTDDKFIPKGSQNFAEEETNFLKQVESFKQTFDYDPDRDIADIDDILLKLFEPPFFIIDIPKFSMIGYRESGQMELRRSGKRNPPSLNFKISYKRGWIENAEELESPIFHLPFEESNKERIRMSSEFLKIDIFPTVVAPDDHSPESFISELKITVTISEWPWSIAEDIDGDSNAFLDLVIEIETQGNEDSIKKQTDGDFFLGSSGTTLSLSNHYHKGFELIPRDMHLDGNDQIRRGNKSSFIFRFPRFDSEISYDFIVFRDDRYGYFEVCADAEDNFTTFKVRFGSGSDFTLKDLFIDAIDRDKPDMYVEHGFDVDKITYQIVGMDIESSKIIHREAAKSMQIQEILEKASWKNGDTLRVSLHSPSSLVDVSSSTCDVFISARFNNDTSEKQARQLAIEANELGLNAYIVNVHAGSNFGTETMRALHAAKTFIAFCTSDYGVRTACKFCTYYELEYANNNDKHILPIKMCHEWPPPAVNPESNDDGMIQNQFIFQPNQIYLDWSDRDWDAAVCAKQVKEAYDIQHATVTNP